MIPSAQTDLQNDFAVGAMPGKTFCIRDKRIVGFIDGMPAVMQAARLALSTERYTCPIFSWNYGVTLADLLGVAPPLLYTRLQQRIQEALLQDDRIKNVSDFSFTQNRDAVLVSFAIETIYGSTEMEELFHV